MTSTARRRILIDARPINHPTARQRGIGRYTAGLIHGLSLAGADVVAASSSIEECEIVRDTISGVDVELWRPELVRRAADADAWYVATQLMLHPITLDPVPDAVTAARLPVAGVMYDVIPERYPERYLTHPQSRQLSTLRTMLGRTLDGLLAISDFAARTAGDVMAIDSSRIVSIGAGVGEVFTPSSDDPWPALTRLVGLGVDRRRDLVVAVTGGDERKNTEGLIRAWAELSAQVRPSHQLVVACAIGPMVMARWTELAEGLTLRVGKDVVFTDSVSDDEIVALHRAARLAVFPSLEEGFGLPVAEAAACDCPVICSDTSSLPEVIGVSDALFDPFDVSAMSHAIEWALFDEAHRDRLRAAAAVARTTWTWKKTGERAMSALDQFGERIDQRRRRPALRKLAVLAPSQASPSAIGGYTTSVLREWERTPGTHIEHLVDELATDFRPAASQWLCSAIGSYRHDYEFDHIVSVLGSSGFHLSTALVAEKNPTHVWLHEASLAGCYLYGAVKSSSEDWARRFIASRCEVGTDFYSLEPEDFHRAGLTLLGPVLDRARSVIVSSHEAAEVVKRVRPDCAPIFVLPLAYPEVQAVQSTPGRRVVSVGWLAFNKRPEVLVHLAHELGVEVDFVGPMIGVVADRVRELAQSLGVSHLVHLRGRLDESEFQQALTSARVGVQLRTGAIGQRSAAVNDLVARGIPVVTNLLSSDESSGGVRGVDIEGMNDPAAAKVLVPILRELLDDDAEWKRSSEAAVARARSWGFGDVARAIDSWLDSSSGLERGSVHVAGPNP